MGMKFAINGFGRIGRNILRAKIEQGISSLKLVAINDLASIENAAFLLEYDSVHGKLGAKIRHDEHHLYINDLPPIRYMSEPDPSKLEWAEFDKLLVSVKLVSTLQTPKPIFPMV